MITAAPSNTVRISSQPEVASPSTPVRVSAAATLTVGLGRLRSALEPRPLVLALKTPDTPSAQSSITRAQFGVLWDAAEKRYGESRDPEAVVGWLAGRLGMGPSAHPHLLDAVITGDYTTDELFGWYEWRQEPRPRFEALWADAEIRYEKSRDSDGEVTRLIEDLGLTEDARFHLTDALITGDFSVEELWAWYQAKKNA